MREHGQGLAEALPLGTCHVPEGSQAAEYTGSRIHCYGEVCVCVCVCVCARVFLMTLLTCLKAEAPKESSHHRAQSTCPGGMQLSEMRFWGDGGGSAAEDQERILEDVSGEKKVILSKRRHRTRGQKELPWDMCVVAFML